MTNPAIPPRTQTTPPPSTGGTSGVQGPWADVTPKQVMDMAVAHLQHRGLNLGDAMDRMGVRREGIKEGPNNTINVPHNGTGTEEQLRNLERLLQRDIDRTFEGSGIRVHVQRPEA